MKTLIQKEAIELSIPTLLLFVLLTAMWLLGAEFGDVLVQPMDGPLFAVLCAAGGGGLFFALLQFHGERVRRTHDYLLHRGIDTRGIFGVKVLVGLCATFAVALGPVLVFALGHAIRSPLASVLQWDRVVELAWASALGASTYAAGALSAQLRRSTGAGLLFGGLGFVTLLALAPFSAISTDGTSPALRYVAIQVAVALGLLCVAERLFARAGDADSPLPLALHRAISAIGIVLVVVPVLAFVGLVQMTMIDGVRGGYPVVRRDNESSRFYAMRPMPEGASAEVDSHGEIVPGGVVSSLPVWSSTASSHVVHRHDVAPTRTTWDADDRILRGDPPIEAFNGEWERLFFHGSFEGRVRVAGFESAVFLDRREGVVHVFSTSMASRDTGFRSAPLHDRVVATVLRRPDERARFSAQTFHLTSELRLDRSPESVFTVACLLDAADSTFWRVSPFEGGHAVRALSLPGGDRLVRLEYIDVPRIPYHYPEQMVIVGERGRYAWNGDELVLYPEPIVPEPTTPLDYEVVFVDPDVVNTRVEVRSTTDGAVLRTQEYGPQSAGDHLLVASAHMLALLRAPLGNAISYSMSFEGARDSNVYDNMLLGERLFVAGKRLWLLVLCVALAAFSARAVVRRLRARGADIATTCAWGIGVALLGLPALWWFLLLEPRGKSVARDAQVAPTPPMILCSEERTPDLRTT